MFKRLIGVLFLITAFMLVVITTLNWRNYKVLNNIETAQVVGLAEDKAYMVFDEKSLVIENKYNVRVGDSIKIIYNEAEDTIELAEMGKFFVLYLMCIFVGLSGLLLLINYNTVLVVATIVDYAVQILLISPYAEGIMLLGPFDAQCNYCKPIGFFVIFLNILLLAGYIVNFGVNFVKESRALMLQNEKLT